jgi:hypothetical protein
MLERSKVRMALKILLLLLLLGGVVKFYHYNYVANTRGQARALRLPGLHEFVCKGIPYKSVEIDQCGKRSIYKDPDWGITAYFTIYGVETHEEAVAIAKFMVQARKNNGQEHIPINLQVYSVPRSAGNRGPVDAKFIFFNQNL